MSKTIAFFDIDGVIFDSQKFLSIYSEKFIQENKLNNSELDNIKNLYQEVRSEKGFFDPQAFLLKISSHYSIANKVLEKLWWDLEAFGKCLLVDESFLSKIQAEATIGIFSKGEINFQNKKIDKFKEIIQPENVYIFEDKIIRISEVLKKYRTYKIYVIDDNINVLEGFKKIDSNVYVILINNKQIENINSDINMVVENMQQLPELLVAKITS